MSSYCKMQDLGFTALHFCLPLASSESYLEVALIYFYVKVYVMLSGRSP